jgi:YHS domain-containing protein
MMKQILKLLVLIAGLCFVTSCVTQPKNTAQTGAVATCHVCRYNNDLACVNIRVKDTTLRAEYHGTAYYFCSTDCREAFLKNPDKFLPKPRNP